MTAVNTELYDRLGVLPSATPAQIKAAYRSVAKTVHPDSGGDAAGFIALTQAFNVLSDPEQRTRYDETGAFEASVVDNTHVEMLKTLSGALDRVISKSQLPVENVDVIGEMHKLMSTSRDMIAQEMEGVDRKLKSLTKVRARIKRKDEAENVFLTVIDGHIKDLSELQTAGRRALKVQGRAVEELEQYDSIVDVIRFVQSGIYTSRHDDQGNFFSIIIR